MKNDSGRQWDAGAIVMWSAAVIGLVVLMITIPWALALRKSTPPCTAQKWEDAKPTEYRLAARYREFNEEYFFGSLPFRKTTVELRDMRMQDWLGHIEQRRDQTWYIAINSEGHPTERQAEMTLIHEMCHQYVVGTLHKVSGLDDNDKGFQACMKNVANQDGFEDLW